ncbi:MAG: hypothetical protein ACRDSG_11605 [Pseudonocardiaceae bacterium]
MATGQTAAAIELSPMVGTLAPGLSADLLVIPGDTLTDLGALRHPNSLSPEAVYTSCLRTPPTMVQVGSAAAKGRSGDACLKIGRKLARINAAE